jgi:hypothetical protein
MFGLGIVEMIIVAAVIFIVVLFFALRTTKRK